jgi:hypothetical protein
VRVVNGQAAWVEFCFDLGNLHEATRRGTRKKEWTRIAAPAPGRALLSTSVLHTSYFVLRSMLDAQPSERWLYLIFPSLAARLWLMLSVGS